MSLLVIVGINALTFTALDKWYHLFVVLTPIVMRARSLKREP